MDQIILCCRGCPVYCRMVNNIPGLCSLDVNYDSPVVPTRNVPRHYQMTAERKNCSYLPDTLLRITDLYYSLQSLEVSLFPESWSPNFLWHLGSLKFDTILPFLALLVTIIYFSNIFSLKLNRISCYIWSISYLLL